MAVNIGPKIGIDGEAEYRRQINNIIQQAKTLDSEMKLVASTFDKSATAQEKAAKTGSVLSQQIETQKDRVKLLSEMLKKSAQQYGINHDATLKWQQAVNEAKASLNKMESEMKDNKEAADGLGKKLDEGGKKAISFSNVLKANILSDAIVGGFRALGSAIKSAVSEFASFAKEGINLASDLEEVQNVVDTTFGKGASEIENFAKGAANAFGMSELSAKQFTGTIGAMFKSMGLADDAVLSMSTSITGLAGDMASFYNLDPQEAFDKLRSGISGETEPLKQLGINMSVANLEAYALAQGITTAYSKMSQAEQATLRYNYIMQATADAQGDFAKTSDSYANQQRILQLNIENLSASIGKKLLPTVNEFTTAVNGLLSGNTSMYEFTDQMSQLVTKTVQSFATALPEMIKAGGQFVSVLLTGIMETVSSPEFSASILSAVSSLASAFVSYLPIMADFGMDLVTNLVSGIGLALPTLIPQAIEGILEMLDKGFVGNIDTILKAGFDLVLGLVEGLSEGLPKLVDGASEMIAKIVVGLVENLPLILEMGIKIILSLINGILKTLPKLLASAQDIGKQIVDKFKKMDWKQIGQNIVQGIINGVKSMWSALWSTMTEMANNAMNAVKKAFDINSPSGTMEEEVGAFLPPGITSGVRKAMPAMIRNLKKEFSVIPSLTVPKTTVPAGNTTNLGGVSITVYGSEGQNVNQLADVVMSKLQNAVDRRREVFA